MRNRHHRFHIPCKVVMRAVLRNSWVGWFVEVISDFQIFLSICKAF